MSYGVEDDISVTSYFRPTEASGDRWDSLVPIWVNPKKVDDIYPMFPYPSSAKVFFYIQAAGRALWYPLGPVLIFGLLFGLI